MRRKKAKQIAGMEYTDRKSLEKNMIKSVGEGRRVKNK